MEFGDSPGSLNVGNYASKEVAFALVSNNSFQVFVKLAAVVLFPAVFSLIYGYNKTLARAFHELEQSCC